MAHSPWPRGVRMPKLDLVGGLHLRDAGLGLALDLPMRALDSADGSRAVLGRLLQRRPMRPPPLHQLCQLDNGGLAVGAKSDRGQPQLVDEAGDELGRKRSCLLSFSTATNVVSKSSRSGW